MSAHEWYVIMFKSESGRLGFAFVTISKWCSKGGQEDFRHCKIQEIFG